MLGINEAEVRKIICTSFPGKKTVTEYNEFTKNLTLRVGEFSVAECINNVNPIMTVRTLILGMKELLAVPEFKVYERKNRMGVAKKRRRG